MKYIALILSLTVLTFCSADIVTLKTGHKLKGVIIDQNDKFVTMKLEMGEMSFPMKKITSIERQTNAENIKPIQEMVSKRSSSSTTIANKAKKQKKPKNIKTIAGGGKVDLKKHLVKGYVVVFDFYADWCGPCKAVAPELKKLAKDNANVILRKIDIINWNTVVVKQHNIRSIPNIWVFDKNGKQVGKPTSNINQVKTYIKEAQEK